MKEFDIKTQKADFGNGLELISVLNLRNKQVAAETDISLIVLRKDGSSEIFDTNRNRTSYIRSETKSIISSVSSEETFKDLIIDLTKRTASALGQTSIDLLKEKKQDVYEKHDELKVSSESVVLDGQNILSNQKNILSKIKDFRKRVLNQESKIQDLSNTEKNEKNAKRKSRRKL